MIARALLIGLLPFLLHPSAGIAAAVPRVSGGTDVRPTVVWPSRRAIRAAVREPGPENRNRVRIRETALDKTFENAETGVKIQYPSSWQRFDQRELNPPLTLIVMFLSREQHPEGLRQNINLVLEDLTETLTLSQYTKLGIAIEKEFFNRYTLRSSDDVLIAGAYRAHRVIFNASLNGGDMTFEQIWLLRGKTAHVWTFADSADVFEQHVKTFERMMDTLTMR